MKIFAINQLKFDEGSLAFYSREIDKALRDRDVALAFGWYIAREYSKDKKFKEYFDNISST